ncbi:2-dehydro-3-deoxygalactonokinase [Microbulbifer thermotolerans]|uniref:2-dehydro-3-deoxygalactonokinase n=1 Tax=Microbulbifer thermotolerans TaxID=252514 RepID=UPI0008EACD3B|nr:2-dehydro-3-deoxygalactonokinase [Microbulbifer thermotolerans]SFC76730.1 2-dehydro-3-deoxygalactonokinase [Microbulbifer thermotolerans]
MSEILVCDWGTSSFRLMRLSAEGEIVGQIASQAGIKSLQNKEIEAYLLDQCHQLDESGALPVILCGMVGSGIGWYEVPYVDCPVSIASLAGAIQSMPSGAVNAYCVPGVKKLTGAEADVMRGEETQAIGWLSGASEAEWAQSLLCLPGTHSKWMSVVDGAIRDFSTAFTGELYSLLKEHSVLVQGEQEDSAAAFDTGLEDSRSGTALIHQLFNSRSRAVLGVLDSAHSASYLSGLLLGCEVRAMAEKLSAGAEGKSLVHLICGDHLAKPYCRALAFYGMDCRHYSGDTYSARGLLAIARASVLV